ncbi:hypothetical protein D3P09_02695 [Paenibacillus pinisoli]|uniref:Uncharacterized protein n=1 Tax=Paenibacillus pinisoli TaxID=1276110 RepID=A0A3A6Q505_9BACL|nr:hypothetical protein [Paenibacillus pinisoli]RJX40944.1 hypothetical protein D3P09_02695 [Paenibacillus pinisoli]
MGREEERARHAEAESELLSIHLMGDVREDAKVLGLSLKDMAWIMGTTVLVGLVPFLMPIAFWYKFIWLGLVFLLSFVGRMLKWPYRRKRLYHDKRYQPSHGTGETMGDLLGMKEDGWFYSNKDGSIVQILYAVKAPPWGTSKLGQKKQRIAAFSSFIRACIKENFIADLFVEQIPDFQHDIWDSKRLTVSDSEGIEQLKFARIAMWSQLARTGKAQRTVYVLRLTINSFHVTGRERDDEPQDLNKNELKRYRFVSELREKQSRVLSHLEQSGHSYSLLSGFVIPELIGRWWDRKSWERWADIQGGWELEGHAETVESDSHITDPEAELESSEDVEKKKKVRASGRILAVIGSLLRSAISKFKQLRLVTGRKSNKKEDADTAAEDTLLEGNGEITIAADTEQPAFDLGRITLLTSPMPSGKTFLAVNVGVVKSSHELPIHIVDLSPDQGCKTALNPLPISSANAHWQAYVSRHAPGLTLWLPSLDNLPGTKEVVSFIEELAVNAPVIVDMPWSYPDRINLMKLGEAVAVVDSDYHHWLQWEKSSRVWEGSVWLNQVDKDMDKAMRSLIKENGWIPNKIHAFPYLSDARRWLFQGLPPTADMTMREMFIGGEMHARSVSTIN